MLIAAEIAVARGTMPSGDREALAGLIAKMGPLPAIADIGAEDILEAIPTTRRSSRSAALRAADGDGGCEVVSDVTKDEIAAALSTVGIRSPRSHAP
jgi:hypothetical protein